MIDETLEDLRHELAEMVSEHRILDGIIVQALEHSNLDPIQLQRLKKRKLQLKDQIARLETLLIPDIIA